MRLARLRRRFDHARILRCELDQRDILRPQRIQRLVRGREVFLRGLAHRRADTRMRVLHVEDRVILRCLDHLGEVEVHLRLGLAGQHGEPNDILADFVHHIRQRYEIARTLGHLHRLAIAHQLDHLDQLDVEWDRLALPLRERGDGGLDPLDRTCVVGTPDIDQRIGVLGLLHVIGEVRAEIGPAAVRLPDRAILIVAELRGAEQRQFDRLPVVGRLALGLFQLTIIDKALIAQPFLRFGGLAGGLQLGLRCEHIVRNAQLGEIGADQVHHRRDRAGAEQPQPFALRRGGVFIPEFLGQRLADRDQVFAGIEPFGNLAHAFAQRFAVPHVGRACEHIDLPARIVDVIFARDLMARRIEQARQRIAHHRAAAVAHVHRASGVGGDIFDVHPAARAHRGASVTFTQRADRAHFFYPGAIRDAQVDETRPRNFGGFDIRLSIEMLDDLLRQRARIGFRGLGQHYRGVRRDIAVRGVARRLHGDIGARNAGRERALHL